MSFYECPSHYERNNSRMPELLFLSGSIRTGSYNEMLAKSACDLALQQGASAVYVDLRDYELPIYNGDLEEKEGLPEAARELKALFAKSDGFFIASPEYNSSFSPLLKNTLDWISRKSSEDEPMLLAFKGKVGALGAASPGGFGGLRGLVPLRMLLGNIGVHVIPSQLAISKAMSVFDDGGSISDEGVQKLLDGVVREFVETAQKHKASA